MFKHPLIRTLVFPLVVITTGVVCALVLLKFGNVTKVTTSRSKPKKVVARTVPSQAVVLPAPAPAPVPLPAVAPALIPVPAPLTAVVEKSPEVTIAVSKVDKVKVDKSSGPVKKRITKRTKKHRVRASWGILEVDRIRRAQAIVVEDINDAYFLNTEVTLALDSSAPLDKIADYGLATVLAEETYDQGGVLALVQFDDSLLSGGFARVPRLTIQEGLIAKNDYHEFHDGLKTLNEQPSLEVHAPELKTDESAITTASIQSALEEIDTADPRHDSQLVEPIPHAPAVPVPAERASEPVPDTNPPVASNGSQPLAAASISEVRVETNNEATNTPEPELVNVPVVAPAAAVPSQSTVTIQNSAPNSTQNKSVVVNGSKSAHPAPQAIVNNQASEKEPPPKESPPDEKATPHGKTNGRTSGRNEYAGNTNGETEDAVVFQGGLTIDGPLRNWLKAQKAHFELYLHRNGSKDPQDTRFIEYEFGESEFGFEGTGMRGEYRLVAAFYTGSGATPVGQVQYGKIITSAGYKEKIIFNLTKRDLLKSISTEVGTREKQPTVINVTVFKGAPGNYRASQPVPKAYVQVVGFKEWGTFTTDSEGNVRIPKVATRSEYLLDIGAQGYYSTRQVVPVFTTNAYAAIYLIQRDDVHSVTHYFTKHEQVTGKSVILGRVYNAATRTPQKDEEVSLSFRKGRAVYFNALPDLNLRATSDTGLFGFFNVEPSIRSLERASGRHAALINILPDYGYYYEFGRGGSRSVKGRLFDPFQNAGVASTVRIVGDQNDETVTDEKGGFNISGVDLPPGILTLEMKSEGFPHTWPLAWHTIPWNTREPVRPKNLFMVSKEVIEESRKINRVVLERGKGTIIGGAESSFFSNEISCVQVQLEDSSGVSLSPKSGPFPLAGAKNPSKGYCLTQASPGFTVFNVPSGEYILKWIDARKSSVFRSRIIRVGIDRVSVVVN